MWHKSPNTKPTIHTTLRHHRSLGNVFLRPPWAVPCGADGSDAAHPVPDANRQPQGGLALGGKANVGMYTPSWLKSCIGIATPHPGKLAAAEVAA